MVSLTESAVSKLKELFAKESNPDGLMLRISFGGYGWGGPSLKLTLDGLSNEKDTVVESQEVKVVYETSIEGYVENAIVDYSDSWYSKGFTIRGGALSSC